MSGIFIAKSEKMRMKKSPPPPKVFVFSLPPALLGSPSDFLKNQFSLLYQFFESFTFSEKRQGKLCKVPYEIPCTSIT